MKNLLIFSLLFFCGSTYAQLDNSTAFKFITNATAESNAALLESGPKYQKALEIYNRLAEARGDRRYPLPAFKMARSQRYVAFLEGDGLSIGIEEKAFDLCMSLGEEEADNALATLLGHELTHFYEKHQWRSNFAEAFNELEIGRTLGESDKLAKVNNETQSDYLGGFLAYSAGFNVYQSMPDFYDKVYKAYGLSNEIEGYPSLSDRKAMATKSVERLQDLVVVFDLANMMTALGRYSDARALYKHVLIEYQGRELYNNLAVVTLLEAMGYTTEEEAKYRLPITLDLNMGAGTKEGFGKADSLKNALIREAISYLNSALSLDSDYAPAMLNKACAYFLLGDDNRARFYAEVEARSSAEAQPEKFSQVARDVDLLMALIAARKGNTDQAISILEGLRTTSPIAAYNLRVLKKEPKGRATRPFSPEDEAIEEIEIRNLNTSIRNWRRKQAFTEQNLFGQMVVRSFGKEAGLEQSMALEYLPPLGSEASRLYVHLTDPGYTGQTFDGYKVGTSFTQVTDAYDAPPTTIQTTNGSIAVYPQIIFFLDSEDKILRWANYFSQ